MPNKTLFAIGCITAIIITCIIKDINGAIVGAGVAAVAGLGGYAIGKIKKP
ncbi:unnamed protein product [marine sediment metagenome]|uniref:Uncharacterized protein n=1 Tax=marine sediment metagenome TaxID=412755 RepID=X1A4C4_9ZZZZ